MRSLFQFVAESNRIEAILRAPLPKEIGAHKAFLALPKVQVPDLLVFVDAVQPGAGLRTEKGMDVRVGRYIPPQGGPKIATELADLLSYVNGGSVSPWRAHVEYETLHPFMDGNGRSGRVLWAWMMQRNEDDPFRLPFLHRAYYQALDEGRP